MKHGKEGERSYNDSGSKDSGQLSVKIMQKNTHTMHIYRHTHSEIQMILLEPISYLFYSFKSVPCNPITH